MHRKKYLLSLYCPPRGRHPCDKGNPEQRCAEAAFRPLLDHRFWGPHPAPWSKTAPGRERRTCRRFVTGIKQAWLSEPAAKTEVCYE